MDVKCIIGDFLAAKLNHVGEVTIESVYGHGDQARITSENGVACIVDIDELVSAATKCKIQHNLVGR